MKPEKKWTIWTTDNNAFLSINNCLFPGTRTSLTRTANLELQWCEEQKASRSVPFIYDHKWRLWSQTVWLLANCSSPWSERKNLCQISIITQSVMVGTELRSRISGPFLGLSARLFLQRAVWKSPQWVGRNAVPYYSSSRGQAMAASSQPAWKLAEKWPITWEKAGEKSLGKIWLLLNSAKLYKEVVQRWCSVLLHAAASYLVCQDPAIKLSAHQRMTETE